MQPHMTSLATIGFLVFGAAAALFILEAQGRLEKTNRVRGLTRAHRACGYGFVLLYGLLCVVMIHRTAGYQVEFSPRTLLHVSIAAAMAPLFVFKILIARRYRKYYAYLPSLGGLLLTSAVVLATVTAGYYYLYRSRITYTQISPQDRPLLDLSLGRSVLPRKCAKCHPLDRVLSATKDAAGWTRTVNRMAAKDAPNIRPFDIKQLIHLLSAGIDASQPLEIAPATTTPEDLVQKKCSACHPLDRVFKKARSLAEWDEILDKMIENAEEIGDYDFLTTVEKNMLARHLVQGR